MKKTLASGAAILAVALTGCNQPAPETPKSQASAAKAGITATPENSVAVVNGTAITKAEVGAIKSELAQRRSGEVSEEKIVDELVKRELLRQDAVAKQLTKNPEYQARIDNAERVILSQIAAEDFMKNLTISDEELQKEYDSRIGAMQRAEYRARHILVDKEDVAKDIIAKLGKGAKFEDLAKKFSKDPGSKNEGGELGWFSPQQMVQPFSEAVEKLKNGEITQAPVQTQFGWHVIQREESRESAPPAFDAVKEQIKSMLQTQKLHQYIDDLMAKAKVERFATPTPTPEASPAAAPAGSLEGKESGAAEPAAVPAGTSAPTAPPKK
ncbi:foldase protein PrsA [Methylococcus capsulatus]|jgi:peptidyl-prolyl cis-trans isomerase C|uniref:peptidylprolyl isomerase n=1 Tax=Methylococcus capsulatus TaxID=414 RepID=A0AA35V891_METCP|nr:peptidylprolyl isomerase [Methylococcus capsulatus]CAI8877445.1 peptidyl-prolyl cis-trans isomerase C [Methylococcus capsulatus]